MKKVLVCFVIMSMLLGLAGCVLTTNSELSTKQDIDATTYISNVSFDEIYKAYKKNELSADAVYKGNRYRITATINGISSGGLLNITGGATLTMEIKVGNTIVFFLAEFEKEQEEALKKVAVGDTIVFEGTCLDAGCWSDCKLIRKR